MATAGQEVGNGYVLIKPTLDEAAVKAVESQGKSSGSMFGGAFSVAAGNLMSQALSKVADFAAEQFKQAFANIMDYEQLAGGAQKIFDEIDYSKIAKDAQNAFKELNMSANDYLATINVAGASFAQTMGDEKGYNVAREGMLAISNYASGTGRNLDELNQKYQMITRSTSSYQSIADQFSGILPATSKDFLEQAKAAGYLKDEYQSLTDVPVAEYQEAVTKMLTKGVDELGLAANTLHESESTMSGSLAMLSSSWQNFLTALGGGEGIDLSQVTNDLISSLGAVAMNIGPALVRIGQSIAIELPKIIGEALQNLAPVVREGLVNAFGENAGEVFDKFVEMVGEVQQAVEKAVNLIMGVVQSAMPVIEQVVVPIVEIIVSGIIARMRFVVEAISSVIDFLQANVLPIIQDVMNWIAENVGPVVQDIADNVNDNMPMIQQVFTAATTAIGQVVSTVWPIVQGIVTTAMDVIGGIVSNVAPVIQGIITTAFNAIKGVADAVWPVVSGIVETAAGVIKGAIDGLSAIVGGVTSTFNAIKEAITNPIETAKQIIGDAINAIKGFFENLHLDIPKPRIPHISIDGGEAPWGIGGMGRLPEFTVDWYKAGGFVDGTRLIGVGEAGPELIWPAYEPYLSKYADALAQKMGGANQTFNVYANDPTLVASVVASKQRRLYA